MKLLNKGVDFVSANFFNVGVGEALTIKSLAEIIAEIIGYSGDIIWDKTKPDGTPKRTLDISIVKDLGWMPRIRLEDGIKNVYEWYVKNAG